MGKNEMILCDTNILIELYKKNSEVTSALQRIGQENIALSSITVAEILFGARNKRELIQINKDVSSLKVIPVNEFISTTFLELLNTYVLSHRLDIPDALIAATALVYDIELYTFNKKDFKFIRDLKLFRD